MPRLCSEIQAGMMFKWPKPRFPWQPKNPSAVPIWKISEVSDSYELKGERFDNWRKDGFLAFPVGVPEMKTIIGFPQNVSHIKWLDRSKMKE